MLGTEKQRDGHGPKNKNGQMPEGGSMEIISVCIVVLIFYGLFKVLLIKIQPNHLGLPEHIFKGRFIEKKVTQENGVKTFNYTLPPPLPEGWHLKNPLFKIHIYSQHTEKIVLDNLEFQTQGGSIFVSGVIVFRKSSNALFRVMETAGTMRDTLRAEIHSFLTREFVSKEINSAIMEIGDISDNLLRMLMRFPVGKEDRYLVNNNPLRRMEILCGIEILSSTLERPEPAEEIKQERDNIAKEKYQTVAKTTERVQLLLDRVMHEIFGTNPDLAANLAHLSQVGELPKNISYKSFHTSRPNHTNEGNLGRQLALLEALQSNSDIPPEQQTHLAEMIMLIKTINGKR